MTETLREAEARDPFAPHDPGCQCWPHVSQQAAIEAAVQAATAEYHEGKAALARSESPSPEGLTEAWAEAEASLPEGRDERALSVWYDIRKPAGWWAAASHKFAPTRPIPVIVKGYDTPAAALLALAARLRSSADSGTEGT